MIGRDDFYRRAHNARASVAMLCGGLAAALSCGTVFFFAPGEWFVRIDDLRILQGASGDVLIVEQRRIGSGDNLIVEWTNAIHETPRPGGRSTEPKMRCSASGSWAVSADAAAAGSAEFALRDWLGGAPCAISDGGTYIASTEWRFAVLGMPKSVARASEPATLPRR
ncbi:MAG: hypothetical protein EA355_06685 [Rhodobacteraceae bacterium]|nr:MAG: hypothetical protein EA355_06685 [Paracoccaceae bacterium]